MQCYELMIEKGGWSQGTLFLHLEGAVDYAVRDLEYKYLECLATMDEDTLEAHYIDPSKLEQDKKTLRKYLMQGDGFCGLMSNYYEILTREVIEE